MRNSSRRDNRQKSLTQPVVKKNGLQLVKTEGKHRYRVVYRCERDAVQN